MHRREVLGWMGVGAVAPLLTACSSLGMPSAPGGPGVELLYFGDTLDARQPGPPVVPATRLGPVSHLGQAPWMSGASARQPRAELNFAAQSSEDIGVGAGLTDAEIGVRVRYDIAREFAPYLQTCTLMATGTTGGRLVDEVGLSVERMLSGPWGGDLQIGARLAVGEVDAVIFLRDPMTPQPHEPDINALVRACDVHDVPCATNLSSARLVLQQLLLKA